ncbi:MAG: hypothetical protein OXR66_09290 [Candidatus Woesearchaeota archaeon]|nr:hypothetical protein [Candidatus Woesearchaeota archaeon]
MSVEVQLKKIGKHLGLVIPDEIVRDRSFKENDKIVVEFIEPVDLGEIFGSLQLDGTAQELKDFARKGWK